jgi:uncharacterized protein YjiK
MPKHLPTLAFLLAHFLTQCQTPKPEVSHILPYDFSTPKKVFELDKDLVEISGLAWWNKDTLVSIQDEKGILYFLSAKNGSILFEADFGENGDYEGVAVKKEHVYVLKSNGNIYRIKKPLKKKTKSDRQKTSLSAEDDLEGFCYYKKEKSFLIAAKERGSFKGKRLIYQLKKGEKDIEKEPYLIIDESELMKRVHQKYGNRLGDNFKPSGLDVHPKSGNLYILSSASRILAVFNQNNELIEAIKLPKNYAKQAEGMCFAPDGTLFISTEGGEGKAKLAKLKMKPK